MTKMTVECAIGLIVWGALQVPVGILNKSSCLNYYLLPEERSDCVIGKLRHPSIFKLPHVHTTRSKTSFINYALDHYNYMI